MTYRCKLGVEGDDRWEMADKCQYAKEQRETVDKSFGCDCCDHYDIPELPLGGPIRLRTSRQTNELRDFERLIGYLDENLDAIDDLLRMLRMSSNLEDLHKRLSDYLHKDMPMEAE